jgi:hypothetical protein
MVSVNIKSFAELIAGDEMAGRFTGWGLDTTGFLTVEASCEQRQREVAGCELDPAVPDDVSEHFDRIRTLHIYGAFYYGFFTLVASQVSLAVELALKTRLRELLPGEANQIDEEGLSLLWYRARRQGLLAHRSTDEFLGTLRDYLDPMQWLGRQKGDFRVDRYDFEAIRELRNHAAHPRRSDTLTPADSARDIQWLAGFTNGLWGPVSPLLFTEVERLAQTITRVVRTADQDAPSADVQCLRAGLILSRRARDAGVAYGEELVHRWEQTCVFYTARYGVAVE